MFNFQFGDFYNSSPNWFDWLNFLGTIVVSTLSIFFAYYLGEKNYKRDKKDKKNEEKRIIKFENELFQENLQILKGHITKQIQAFEEYMDEKKFILKVVPMNVNFLNFIDVKSLYKNNKQNKDVLNSLLISLYRISKLDDSITDEFRTFIRRFNELEAVFKDNYRLVFYDLYSEVTNRRVENIVEEDNIKRWSYNDNDKFMKRYSNIVQEFLNENKSGADREKIKNKLKNMVELSGEYIPEDYDAIRINGFANKSYHAYLDMEKRIESHFSVIKVSLEDLKLTNHKIERYLSLVLN